MKIVFDTPEEEQAVKKKLNEAMSCDICNAFNVGCMCKRCAYNRECEANLCCGCGDYLLDELKRKGEEAKA